MWLLFLLLLSRPSCPAKSGAVEEKPNINSQTHIFKKGETISQALSSMQLPDTTVLRIISSLKDKINLRKCDIEDKLSLIQKGDSFFELKYESQKETWIVDSSFEASSLQKTLRYVHLKGVIEEGVLWDGIISAGGTPQLIYAFADEVFAWDIDFNVETQKGDSFEIFTTAEYCGDRFIGYGRILFARYVSSRIVGTNSIRAKEYTGVYYTKTTTAGGATARGATSSGYYNLDGKSLKKLFLRAPVAYQRISSRFTKARFHPILRKWTPHFGVDYVAPMGTPIRTIGDGTVTFAGWRGGFGKSVIVQHPRGFTSYYGHLSKIASGVKKGRRVNQGTIIGNLGSTGLSTGPHLDFRLQQYTQWVNPIKIIPPPIEPLSGKNLVEYRKYTSDMMLLLNALEVLNKMQSVKCKV